MKRDKLIYTSFTLSFILSIIGSMMKIMHLENANFILGTGIVALAVFVFASLFEIFQSTRIRSNEKIMWLVGFLALGWFAGLVYLLLGRKRVAIN
jgi:Phospholipase_D-nuclease N-terminal